MSGKWDLPEVPKAGWVCVDIEDLEEPSATCEMCEAKEIRYVHTMRHPDYPEELRCGCICAGHMEEDISAARDRERSMRSRAGRKRKWLQRLWRSSDRGNDWIKAGAYMIVVYPTQGHWAFRITNTETESGFASRKPLASEDAAKLRAFDAMCWMEDRGGKVGSPNRRSYSSA